VKQSFFFRVQPGEFLSSLFSPKHNLTLPEMPIEAIENIVHTWQERIYRFGNVDYINHVQIF
jgi:UDPglucose--hexose-1-phosphate uridylyltransferase